MLHIFSDLPVFPIPCAIKNRNRDYIIKLNEFNYKSQYEEFYRIFCWIFQDANEYDKIALTRNVIGMYCKYSHILDIDEKTFLAIKSNYNIYLKEDLGALLIELL